jgi:excisionase family DNA binding protein
LINHDLDQGNQMNYSPEKGGRTFVTGGRIYHVSPDGTAYEEPIVQEEPIVREDPNIQPKALSIEHACRVSGLGKTKLYELIGAGTLKSRKVGRRRLILLTDLSEFLQSLPTE